MQIVKDCRPLLSSCAGSYRLVLPELRPVKRLFQERSPRNPRRGARARSEGEVRGRGRGARCEGEVRGRGARARARTRNCAGTSGSASGTVSGTSPDQPRGERAGGGSDPDVPDLYENILDQKGPPRPLPPRPLPSAFLIYENNMFWVQSGTSGSASSKCLILLTFWPDPDAVPDAVPDADPDAVAARGPLLEAETWADR